jgi:hypothetical protein
VLGCDEGKEGVSEGDGFGGGLVHLPVGGDEWLAHSGDKYSTSWGEVEDADEFLPVVILRR